jgi:ribosomal protein S9
VIDGSGQATTSGGRKEAIARVRMIAGGGAIVVNGRPVDKYFP